MVSSLIFWIAVATIATGIVWVASDRLETVSGKLASYYGMPQIVQGAVITAIASSFPELSATVLSTLIHGRFDLGVGAIVGSAIFNLLVIPAASGISARGIDSSRAVVYKEAQFYMISVSVLLITFAFAVIYSPVQEAGPYIKGVVDWKLALIPVGFYGVYLFTQFLDTSESDTPRITQDVSILGEWLVMVLSLVVIAIGVEGLVQSAIHLGDLFNTPDFIWGLTIIAASTSLPDTLVSVKMAREGRGVASLSNILGSNTFDLLICIPAGVLVAGEAVVNFSVAVPMMGFLTLASIIVFGFLRTNLELTSRESVALLFTYFLFLLWLLLETLNITQLIPGT